MCVMIVPSHNYQLINALLILSKGVDNKYHLDPNLDDSISITHLCWSFQNGYILIVMLSKGVIL
jgi:hypothetical protein